MLAPVLRAEREPTHMMLNDVTDGLGGQALVDPISMDWRHDASCRDVDPELFFPIGTTGPALAQIEAAKAICGTCAVQAPCLEWALATAQDAGIWGGLTEDERRAIRRDRVAAHARVAV
jgi:WhiB family redox-sensing transcriptional regulator